MHPRDTRTHCARHRDGATPIWRGAGRRLDWTQPKTAGHRRARKRIEIEALLTQRPAQVSRSNSLWITLRALAPERLSFLQRQI